MVLTAIGSAETVTVGIPQHHAIEKEDHAVQSGVKQDGRGTTVHKVSHWIHV